jgi:hypothetical protein
MSDDLKPCPFCGGEASDTGFMTWSKAEAIAAWNTRREFAPVVIHQVDPTAIREAALREAAFAIWNGPIMDYARAARGPELNAAHACRDAIFTLIGETKMSDDLIKRLRDRTFLTGSLEGLAASRIEELEESNKELTLQLLATSGQAADALEKLAKAVGALQKISRHANRSCSAIAARALAELGGWEMTCPPCTHNCNEGRDCPARKK